MRLYVGMRTGMSALGWERTGDAFLLTWMRKYLQRRSVASA